MARMAQEIREAGYNPSSATTFNPMISFSATGLTIQNDWNANGAIDNTVTVTDPVKGTARGEQVIYALTGTNLTATAGNVRTVVMTATVSQFTGSSAAVTPANVVLTNRVRLRNK
jgi:hypothetical protein